MYHSLFLTAPNPYLILKPDPPRFTILEVNERYLGVTKTKRDDIVGRGLFEVFPDNPDDAEATGERNLHESLTKVIETGQANTMAVQRYDIPRPAEQGGGFEERYWSPLNTPVFDDDGHLAQIIHYVEDVTENRALKLENERRLHAEAAAAAANQVKSQFLAKMSHELRTPLNAIAGYVELLEIGSRGPVTEEQIEFLRRIKYNQQHLLALINEVLDVSSIASGGIAYRIEDVRVCNSLEYIEEMVRPLLLAKELQFTFDECSTDLIVHADAERISQIMMNLLSNATKHTDKGGTIHVWCETGAATVTVFVQDSGCGIAEDQIEAVFQPFTQANPSAPSGGVGLGLHISQELARGMGAEIGVESELGVGSTFSLRLPRVELSAAATPKLTAAPPL